MNNICKNCSKEFEKEHFNQKYCSDECCRKAKKKQDKIYGLFYRQTEKSKESVKNRLIKYRNSEKGKNKIKEYHKKYRETLIGKLNHRKGEHKRRIKKLNGIHKDYTSQLKEVKSLKTFTCYWCGEKHDIKDLHLDHIIPLSKGGADIWDNIALSCANCNLSKQNKLPEEFNKTLEQPRLFI